MAEPLTLGRWIDPGDLAELGERAVVLAVEDDEGFITEDIFESHLGATFTRWQPEDRGDPQTLHRDDLGSFAEYRGRRLLAVDGQDREYGYKVSAEEVAGMRPGMGALLRFDRTTEGSYLEYDLFVWLGQWQPVDGNSRDGDCLTPDWAANLSQDFPARLLYARDALPAR